jgi:hypothetical protein
MSVVLAFLLVLGQALMRESLPIALDPLNWHVGTNPRRGDLSENM